MNRTVPELLAPAGTPGALEAACAAGADAVYLGGSRFGARAAAGFDAAALEAAVEYAHARDVRVYVTVNTLVTDRELAAVADDLVRWYAAGADAVLVQDAGVASVARELVPDLPLHASTQMTVHSADGVRAAADLGCTRVVLARELSLAEVEAIATAVPEVELEVFAHGALCYAWSGQCLLSSAIGGRSGNRGRCAQPCRKPFRLLRGAADEWGRLVNAVPVPVTDAYLLSPRDLRTYSGIGRLIRAPITALKIEGRLRSPAYVGAVVGCYRAALDRGAAGDAAPVPEEVEALGLAFHRGFTRGRLFGESGDACMGRDRPGPRGIRVGTVAGTDRSGRTLVRFDDGARLESGDGLVAAPRGRPDLDVGTVLRHAAAGGTVPVMFGRAVPAGTPVFLTSRAAPWHPPAVTVGLEVDIGVDEERRPVAKGIVRRRRDTPISFQAVGESMAPARSQPLVPGILEEHLRRTGGTPYAFSRVTVDLPGGLFAPASVLNAFRRTVLAAAAEALVEARRPGEDAVAAARARFAAFTASAEPLPAPRAVPRVRCLVDTPEAAGAAARAGADEVCLEPRASPGASCACLPGGPEAVLAALGDAAAACGAVPVLWAWPRITRQRFLDAAAPLLASAPVAGVLVGGLGAALAVAAAAPGLPVHGGPGLNLWNSRAVRRLAGRFASLTLSPELSRRELADAVAASRATGVGAPLGVMVQGNLELMVTDDCLLSLDACPSAPGARFALEDDRRRFPVLADGECRGRILNAVETCLIDHLSALVEAGADLLVVDARGRTPAWAAAVAGAYRAGLDAPAAGRGPRLAALKEELRSIAAGGITAGPFERGRREEEQLLPGSEHDTTCHRSSS
jgi:U32 family peptidase